MRYVAGYIEISSQLLDEIRAVEDAYQELEWIATHYNEATDEQRARFDAWQPDWDALEEMYEDE